MSQIPLEFKKIVLVRAQKTFQVDLSLIEQLSVHSHYCPNER